MTTGTTRIADFTSGLHLADLPMEVREKMRVALLHNLGVALAAGPLAQSAVAYATAAADFEGRSGARLLVSGREVAPLTAAYVNAAMMHARAQDDVFFPGLTHVGASVIPALLAVGERRDSSGAELLVAMAAGYEAAGAVSEGFAQRTTARGFRATGLYGVLGAAAAVARLLELDAEQTANALGIATCMSSGTNQTWVAGTQEWQFQLGLCAVGGIRAALQAAAGGTGAPDALEGRTGFYSAFMGDAADADRVGTDLGSRWRIADVTFKPYPVCAILQAPVSELVAALSEGGVKAADVERVGLVLTPVEAAYPGTDSTGPFRDVGATLMSAPYCLAVAMIEGRVTAADLARQDDPAVIDLLGRVEVSADPALASRSFRLEVDLAGGGRLDRAFTAAPSTYNWNRDEVVAQLRLMADELPFGDGGIEALAAAALSVEARTVRDVVSACVAARS